MGQYMNRSIFQMIKYMNGSFFQSQMYGSGSCRNTGSQIRTTITHKLLSLPPLTEVSKGNLSHHENIPIKFWPP